MAHSKDIYYMVVSINGASLKWMVYNGKSHFNRLFRGTPISGNFHIDDCDDLFSAGELEIDRKLHLRCSEIILDIYYAFFQLVR